MTTKQNYPPLLIGETFSPWTKKARWALELCGLKYIYKEYTPTLSEPALRWRLRQLSGSVSVPVLFAGPEVLRGSWDIACYATKLAGDGRLGDMKHVKRWNDLSEAALAEGRTDVVRRILNTDKALEESLPSFMPKYMRRSFRFLARDAAQRLDNKYAHLRESGALRHALLETRENLAQSKTDYLLGDFTYADITMAVIMEIFAPIAHTNPTLGVATQQCWSDAELAREFSDLVLWRNRLAKNVKTTYSQFQQD